MRSYLSSFLMYIRYEKGASEHTISAYESDLSQFMSWLGDRDIEDGVLESYLQYLSSQSYESTSMMRKSSVLRRFLTYLSQESLISTPVSMVKPRTKARGRLPRSVPQNQLLGFLDNLIPLNGKDSVYLRDLALLELLYATGIRVSELVLLNLSDIDWELLQLKVCGKGQKERLVLFSDRAGQLLHTYIQQLRPLFCRSKGHGNRVFLSRNGRPLSRQAVYAIVKKYGQDLGLKDLTPHSFRHSFATHLLENGADLRQVQQLLGHAHVQTTEIYTKVAQTYLKKMYSQAHPRGGQQ
tara:strand:- start:271 stop:1158 length:888 start_codon:yes stop_codon:yes gene_type:complete